MSGLYNIQQFQPQKAKPFSTWLIVGARGSGKSTLLENLLFHLRGHIEFPMAMTPTVSTIRMLEKHMPGSLIHHGYDFEAADKFVSDCKELVKRGKIRKVGFFNDDCMFDSKVMKTTTQRYLHLNGRHIRCTEITISQYSMIVPPVIRGNIDYVISLKEPSKNNKKKLYEYFFGCFPTYSDFNRVFTSLTENHGAIVMDRTGNATTVNDCIFHYRAPPVTPPFTLGKRVFFVLDQAKRALKRRQNKTQGPQRVV
uniref:Uncharacterized protein n=1 Tax=viral metagenome TaxID=1070528 RepID=A0A6C0BP39_9ZZZZ